MRRDSEEGITRSMDPAAPVEYAQRILSYCGRWLDVKDAQFCLGCEAVFRKSERACPACGSTSTTPLLAFLAP